MAVLAGARAQNFTFGFGHGVANYTPGQTGHADNVPLVLGEDTCDYICLGVFCESTCELNGGWFTTPDGCSYQFTGCGTGLGNFCLYNDNNGEAFWSALYWPWPMAVWTEHE